MRETFDYDAHGLAPPARRPRLPGGAPQTVAAVLDAVLRSDPDRLALVGRSGRLTYAQLDRAVDQTAAALSDLGVERFDRVAVCLPNDLDNVVSMLASQRLGAIWVGINKPLAAPEKTLLLGDSGARVFLAMPEVAEAMAPYARELPALQHLLTVDPNGAAHPSSWAARVAAFAGARRPDCDIDPHAPAAIAYTSGTTGHPKGAVHSQHNLLLPGAVSVASGRYGGRSQGVVLALNMLNLQILGPLTAFQDGARCIAIDRIDPEGLAEWIRSERIQNVCAVPTVLHDLLAHPGIDPDDLASLVLPEVGGALVPEEFRRLYRERFGRGVSIGYGMTEAPTAVTWSDPEAGAMPGLCGRPLPQIEIQIRDESGNALAPGEVGEICVAPAAAGPFLGVYTPMIGYWERPEATAEALRDGVYHSGDLGLLADDGNLYIRGRRNELILRGGANVYPAEVERILQEHPRVAGSAVLGIEDPRLGERVVAAVELKPDRQVTPEELIEHARAQLARYKVPEQIVIVERLPRNAMSKVIKHELRQLFVAETISPGGTTMSKIDDSDFFTSNELLTDPFPYFEDLRAQCPVHREPHRKVMMVTGYDEAHQVYNDTESFSSCISVTGPFPGFPVPLEGKSREEVDALIAEHRHELPMSDQLPTFDPPMHTAHRALLMRLITPRRLKENEEFIYRLTDRTLDGFIARGKCEYNGEFATPLAMLVVADLLGVPEEDRETFREVLLRKHGHGGDKSKQMVGSTADDPLALNPLEFLYQRFSHYIADRRGNPREDVLTGLAKAKFPDGTTPEVIDVVRVAANLFAAGQETTVRLLSSGVMILAENPRLQERLRAKPDSIANFVEETLRVESPVKGDFRLARCPVQVGGVDIPAGTTVMVLNAAANRDPRQFDDPARFDIERANARQHMAFGRGIHTCPGAPLARAEASISFQRLLERTRNIRISEAHHGPPGARRYQYVPTFILRGLTQLHIEFDPA